jgi:hypothetical protein
MKTIMMCSNMKKELIFILSVMALCVSCQKNAADDTDGQIYLSAVIENTHSTKSPYSQVSPSQNNILKAAVWASSTDRVYKNKGFNGKTGDGSVAIHTSANFSSSKPQLLSQAVYPKNAAQIYFVGFYPSDEWSVNDDGNKADFKFEGNDDVMFAPQISGAYAQLYENSPTLHFRHLLTWLKVKIVADDESTMKAWGDILSMKITSNNYITVDLSKNYVYEDCVEYGNVGTGLLPLYTTGSDDVFPPVGGYSMPYKPNVSSPQEVAYVLCAPVIATASAVVGGVDTPTAEYTLHIETSRRKVSLPIDLRINDTSGGYYTGSTRGKYFTLNLTFKMGNTIVVSSKVQDWALGGFGDMSFDE